MLLEVDSMAPCKLRTINYTIWRFKTLILYTQAWYRVTAYFWLLLDLDYRSRNLVANRETSISSSLLHSEHTSGFHLNGW